MTPNDLLAERRTPSSPVTFTNAATGFKPMTFDSQKAYDAWLKRGPQTAAPAPVKAPKALPKAKTGSAVAAGINKAIAPPQDDDEVEVMAPRTRSTQVAPVRRTEPTELDHDYDEYPDFNKMDDEDDAYATSKVAKKAALGGANSVLIDEIGQKTIVRSFFSFPMLHAGGHQFYSTSEPLDKALYQSFKSSINAAEYPMVKKGVAKSGPKVSYIDNETVIDAAVQASHIIADVFSGEPLATHHGRPIFWVNHSERSKAQTFALSHWVRIAPGTKLEDGDIVDHFIFGYFDSNGIPTAPTEPAQVVAAFNVGAIERITNSFGVGAVALKRMSALKPNRALGMTGDFQGKADLEGLDQTVEGKLFTRPWPQVKAAIKRSYENQPVKRDKLGDIVEELVGRSVASPVSYPVTIEGVSVSDVGFSTNALTVDFMEILHPLIMMKNGGVINNGAYNAARAYLADLDDDDKFVLDLASCHVAYPSASNAKLFDSMLINPRTGGRLLISSKDGQGAMPGVASMGAVYSLFEKNLENLLGNEELGSDIDTNASRMITMAMEGTKDEFRQMIKFFSVMSNKNDKDKIKSLMPRNAGARALAERMLVGDPGVADDLNVWDGGNKFGRGEFLRFVSQIMRFTPLVQVSTNADKPGSPEYDRADTITISGFTATWPNPIFDKVHFAQLGKSIKFKIGVGEGNGEVATRVANNKRGERVYRVEPRFDKGMIRDYDGQAKHRQRFTTTEKLSSRSLKVPGFGKSWTMLKREISNTLKTIFIRYGDDIDEVIDAIQELESPQLRKLYDAAMKFQIANGFDPGMSEIPDMTVRDLLNIIGQALEG